MPDPIRSFADIHAAPECYRAYIGRFALDAAKLPPVQDLSQPATVTPNRVPAEFAVHQQGPTGFNTPVGAAMLLQLPAPFRGVAA